MVAEVLDERKNLGKYAYRITHSMPISFLIALALPQRPKDMNSLFLVPILILIDCDL